MNNDNRPEPIFPDGINFYKVDQAVKDKMPWMKGKITLDVNKIIPFMKKMRELGYISPKGYIFLDLKESKKEGNPFYLQVNTYKSPESQNVEKAKEDIRSTLKDPMDNFTSPDENGNSINPADIPFN